MKRGQSLIEIIVGLGIGVLIIGATTGALLFVSRSGEGVDKSQTAGVLANSLLDSVTVMAEANWNSLYGVSKGSDNPYFVIFTGTTSIPMAGKESILSKDVTSGLVGYWKFDEGSGNTAYDSSRNNNNGSLINGPAKIDVSNCKAGGCLSFNSSNSNFVDLGTNSVLDQDNFSFAGWIKPASVNEGSIFGGFNTSHYKNLVALSSGKVKLDQDPPGGGELYSNTTLSPGNWYYVVVVQDSSQRAIYINGVMDSSDSNVENYTDGVIMKWAIGKREYHGSNYEYYNGLLDDLRLYNRALTGSEVADLYNSSVYIRYFYVDNVSRGSSQNIESTYNVNDDDPSTQKVTIRTEWLTGNTTNNVEIATYLTRWANNFASQTDWSGGDGVGGPVTDFGSFFASSSNIDFSVATGSIRIIGL